MILIYIGDKFYFDGEQFSQDFTWNLIKYAVLTGQEVYIRHPTQDELADYQARLNAILG